MDFAEDVTLLVGPDDLAIVGYDCKLSLVHGAFIWHSQFLVLRRKRLAAKGEIGFTRLSTFLFGTENGKSQKDYIHIVIIFSTGGG